MFNASIFKYPGLCTLISFFIAHDLSNKAISGFSLTKDVLWSETYLATRHIQTLLTLNLNFAILKI